MRAVTLSGQLAHGAHEVHRAFRAEMSLERLATLPPLKEEQPWGALAIAINPMLDAAGFGSRPRDVSEGRLKQAIKILGCT